MVEKNQMQREKRLISGNVLSERDIMVTGPFCLGGSYITGEDLCCIESRDVFRRLFAKRQKGIGDISLKFL